jgi:hypothetical protein
MFRAFLFSVLMCVLAAGTAQAKRLDRYTVDFGSLKINWSDFLQISPTHAKAFAQNNGESLFMFVALPTPGTTVTFKKFIELSEQAVKAEGHCQWFGYDRALDQQARAVGQLARSKDERLFFARLKCTR